jgi:hypothetical protein
MERRAENSVRLLIGMVILATCVDRVRVRSSTESKFVPIGDLSVNANLDPPEMLRLLPGVGPVIAERIVDQRAIRPFEDSDEFVERTRGLGQGFLANYGRWLRFETSDSPHVRASTTDAERSLPQVIGP